MSTASRAAQAALDATKSLKYNDYDVTRDWKATFLGNKMSGQGDYLIYNPNDTKQAVRVSGGEYGGTLGTFVTKQGSLSDFGGMTQDQLYETYLSPQDYAVQKASKAGVQGDSLNTIKTPDAAQSLYNITYANTPNIVAPKKTGSNLAMDERSVYLRSLNEKGNPNYRDPNAPAVSSSNSKYPAPGETVGDLFTNASNGATYNWKTGELVNDPSGKAIASGQGGSNNPAPVNQPAQSTQPNSNSSAGFSLTAGNLSSGSSGDNVKQLQTLLGITSDGSFGPQTKSAVMAFQQANGLTVDGIVGPITQAALAKGGSTQNNTTTTEKPIVGYSASGSPIYGGPGTLSDPNLNKSTQTNNPAITTPEQQKQQEIKTINEEFNAEQEKELESLKKSLGTQVDVSDSKKLVDSLIESYEDKQEEDKPDSLEKQFADKRKELKLDDKEKELQSIDAEIASLDSNMLTLGDKENNRVVSMGQINRRKTEEQIQYERARADLQLKKNTIVNELDMKYGVIDSFMKYAGQDYEIASNEYNTKFSQALSLINLVKNVEETSKSDAEKATDNARANLQIMIDSLKGQDFDSLDSKTKLEIRKMELSAGLPAGFTDFAVQSINEPIVSMGSEFTDASNKRQVPIYTKDPVTGLITAKIITIGTDKAATVKKETEAQSEADDIEGFILEFKDKIKKNNWRGINPDAYEYYKAELLREYGASAVAKFNKRIKEEGLQIDDASFQEEDGDLSEWDN